MIKILSLRLKHCNALANSMSNASPTQLQQFKTQLSEQMGKPVGLHTMGIPAAISTLGVIVSFAIPQLWLGYGVHAALSQPAERVFVWVVLVALLFGGQPENERRQPVRHAMIPVADAASVPCALP